MDPLFVDPLILLALGGALAARKDRMTKEDRAFLREMIAHHEEAVRLANRAIASGASGRVLALARRIASAQTKEIAQMRSWLAASRRP